MLCTDGLANVGLGSLDGKAEAKEASLLWYEAVGALAQQSGTSVRVLSIKGSECALEALGKVAELSGGEVDRVDPEKLSETFAAALSKKVLATNVSVRFLLHQALSFRNEASDQSCVITRDVGNVGADTEQTFEFAPGSKIAQFPTLTQLPFQLQISYKRLDGIRCVRVISKFLPVTRERKIAEAQARVVNLNIRNNCVCV